MKVSIESKVKSKCAKTLEVLQAIRAEELKLGQEAEKELRDKTPKKTGVTSASWKMVLGTGTSWVLAPLGRERIMGYLEFGTKPHIIQALPGSVLAFEVNGETVFTAVVHHPGTKPLGIVSGVRMMVEKRAEQLVNELSAKIKGIWS